MAHLSNNRLCGCTNCRPIRDARMPGDSGAHSITDPDAAACAARACESDDAAAALLFKGVGWRALLTLARRAGIKAGEQANMTRAWCARLAQAVRQ